MVTLLCFCCDHRNPAGSKFCNACGTPLHLKPCRHCEAINTRAAAHCHQCGETFALEFLSLDDAAELEHAPAATPALARREAQVDPPLPPQRQHSILRARIAALLVGLTATAMLSAYFAYRQPGGGPDSAGAAERPSAEGAAPHARPGGRPEDAQTRPAQGSSASPAEPWNLAGGNVAATATPNANRSTVPNAANGRVTAHRSPTDVKNGAAAAAKPASAVRRQSIPPGQDATNARAPAPADRPREPERQVARAPIALQQTVAMVQPLRSSTGGPAPVTQAQRSRDAARRPVPAMGAWDRPCAEGVALDQTCDIRMMAKGN